MQPSNWGLRARGVATVLAQLLCGTASAQDDGARTYWKAMEGTNIVAFQYLPFAGDTFGSQVFDPVHYTYPVSRVQANLVMLTYGRHFTFLGQPSVFSTSLMGGNLDVESSQSPLGLGPAADFQQGAHGFGDPNAQLSVNLAGAPAIKSFYHISKYEPKAVLDIAVMGAFPIGEYDPDKVVNLGLNRWWTRVALPFTYHLGPFVPGYRASVEIIPSVMLFGSNDDVLGHTLANDPLYQLEAHVTRDFTARFFSSVDVLYRHGALSEIDGSEVAGELDILSAGFTLDYHVNDNVGLRVSYHSIVGGDSNLDGDMFRFGVNFGWHGLVEKIKKLQSH
jgi:hypothetical protein